MDALENKTPFDQQVFDNEVFEKVEKPFTHQRLRDTVFGEKKIQGKGQQRLSNDISSTSTKNFETESDRICRSRCINRGKVPVEEI